MNGVAAIVGVVVVVGLVEVVVFVFAEVTVVFLVVPIEAVLSAEGAVVVPVDVDDEVEETSWGGCWVLVVGRRVVPVETDVDVLLEAALCKGADNEGVVGIF